MNVIHRQHHISRRGRHHLGETEEVHDVGFARALAVLRIAFGVTFLWAFLDKTFALGFRTGYARTAPGTDFGRTPPGSTAAARPRASSASASPRTTPSTGSSPPSPDRPGSTGSSWPACSASA